MGFPFETLQKVLTFVQTLAEIAQLVEHQLPKLRAAGSNPVFRSKANRMMPTGIIFFLCPDRTVANCLHKELDGHKKACAQHNGLLSGAPAWAYGNAQPSRASKIPLKTENKLSKHHNSMTDFS